MRDALARYASGRHTTSVVFPQVLPHRDFSSSGGRPARIFTRGKVTLSLWQGRYTCLVVPAGWWRRLGGWILASLGVLWLHGFWLGQLNHLTGEARWVWVTQEIERPYPVRGVFAASFTVSQLGPGALLKISGDREYVARVNGIVAGCGWSRPGFRLDVYDISHLLRPGLNTLELEVRSPTSVGGLLAAVDLPAQGKNVLVTGRDFFLVQEKDQRFPPPVVWGSPPRFPWGYPRLMSRPRTIDQVVLEVPVRLSGPSSLAPNGLLYALEAPIFGYLWVEPGDNSWLWYAVGEGEKSLQELRKNLTVFTGAPEGLLNPEPQWVSQILLIAKKPPKTVEIWPVAQRFRSQAPGFVPGKYAPVPRTRWYFRNPPE